MANLVTVPKTIWTDELFLLCPGASPAGVEQALFNCLREFTKQSGAWVVELWQDDGSGGAIPFNLGTDAPFYDFQAMLETERTASGPDYVSGSPGTAIDQFYTIENYYPWDVLYVRSIAYFESYTQAANPSEATQTAARFLAPGQSQWARAPGATYGNATGWPATFKTYNERPGAIQLYPTLAGNTDVNEGIVPWVSLGFPRSIGAMSIPVIFERMWYEHILDGTAGRLMSQQDKPYTNPTLAQYHLKRFRNGISEARDMAMRQFNTTERGWQFPQWA